MRDTVGVIANQRARTRPPDSTSGSSGAELEALRAEVVRALYLTPLDEVMGRGVMADQVPAIAALLRAAGRVLSAEAE